jgi:hypothetical protein
LRSNARGRSIGFGSTARCQSGVPDRGAGFGGRGDVQSRLAEPVDQLLDQVRQVPFREQIARDLREIGPQSEYISQHLGSLLAVADREMPGFGEQMRRISLEFVPTAILSRQVAVVRGRCLILNLPGQPKSIRETLEGLKSPEGKTLVAGIFAAVPYCVDLVGGPYIETREEVVKAFRPKSAIRPRS